MLLGIPLAEGALRLYYPTLPSLAGLAGQTTWQEGEAIQRCDATALARVDPTPPPASGRRLLVTGDSVALGFGVPTTHRFGARLAEALSQGGEPWFEANRALAGATACVTIELSRRALAEQRADLAVVALFADDLMEAPRFWVNGHNVAFPSTVHTPALRWAVSSSYAVNTVWWAYATTFLNHSRSLAHDAPTVATFRRGLTELRAEAGAVPLVLVLLPPAGVHACAAGNTEPEVCALAEEQDHIAALLDQAWPGWVDLRAVFDDADYRLDQEKADGRLDIHPNADGHSKIAAALVPAARAALAQRAVQQRKPM